MNKTFLRKLKYNFEYWTGSKEYIIDNGSDEQKLFILDQPAHGNLGDQAIAFAENEYLKRILPKREIIEITEDVLLPRLKSLQKSINSDDIIFLNGGGNFGNLYLRYEEVRRMVISKFPNNRIIIFPQTIFFEDTTQGKKELIKSQSIYNKHKYLTIVAREPQSYKLIKKYFDKVNIIETPDIVLSLELALEEFPREGIITLLRDDKEKKEMPQISSLLVELSKQFEISTSDTHLGENFFERIDHQNRKSILNEKWKEIAQNKLVITDRLHGMIFSYITKTPCIVFSNSNYKIRETYKKYLSESKSIMFIENMDDSEIISIVKELISKPFDSIENFENNYTILEKIIKGE